MRLLICGSREWTDGDLIRETILKAHPVVIVHGASRGADMIAGQIARGLSIPVIEYPADWKKYGRAAGPIRNKAMLDTSPDAVIAFKDGFDWSFRRGGTEHMIRIAQEALIPARVISHDWCTLCCTTTPCIHRGSKP